MSAYSEAQIANAARAAARETALHGLAFTHAFCKRMVRRHIASSLWYSDDIEAYLRKAQQERP